MIKREDFKKIIKLRSYWKIDRRKGNYTLPNKTTLKDYVSSLVDSQIKLDSLAIDENGDFYSSSGLGWDEEKDYFSDYTIYKNGNDEICDYDTQEKRINMFIRELIG